MIRSPSDLHTNFDRYYGNTKLLVFSPQDWYQSRVLIEALQNQQATCFFTALASVAPNMQPLRNYLRHTYVTPQGFTRRLDAIDAQLDCIAHGLHITLLTINVTVLGRMEIVHNWRHVNAVDHSGLALVILDDEGVFSPHWVPFTHYRAFESLPATARDQWTLAALNRTILAAPVQPHHQPAFIELVANEANRELLYPEPIGPLPQYGEHGNFPEVVVFEGPTIDVLPDVELFEGPQNEDFLRPAGAEVFEGPVNGDFLEVPDLIHGPAEPTVDERFPAWIEDYEVGPDPPPHGGIDPLAGCVHVSGVSPPPCPQEGHDKVFHYHSEGDSRASCGDFGKLDLSPWGFWDRLLDPCTEDRVAWQFRPSMLGSILVQDRDVLYVMMGPVSPVDDKLMTTGDYNVASVSRVEAQGMHFVLLHMCDLLDSQGVTCSFFQLREIQLSVVGTLLSMLPYCRVELTSVVYSNSGTWMPGMCSLTPGISAFPDQRSYLKTWCSSVAQALPDAEKGRFLTVRNDALALLDEGKLMVFGWPCEEDQRSLPKFSPYMCASGFLEMSRLTRALFPATSTVAGLLSHA